MNKHTNIFGLRLVLTDQNKGAHLLYLGLKSVLFQRISTKEHMLAHSNSLARESNQVRSLFQLLNSKI